MRGRKPKPTALKLVDGNPGKRKARDEPQPKSDAVRCPAHLSRLAKRRFRALSAELGRLGLLTNLDIDALAAYCAVWARWVEAERALNGDSGPVSYKNSNLLVANRCLKEMRAFMAEFGMTPSARTRVSVETTNAHDELEALLNAPRAD